VPEALDLFLGGCPEGEGEESTEESGRDRGSHGGVNPVVRQLRSMEMSWQRKMQGMKERMGDIAVFDRTDKLEGFVNIL